MSLHQPSSLLHDFATVIGDLPPDAQPLGDRHQRLFEAGSLGCCAEGDLLALMPSADIAAPSWGDDRTWLRRILGF